MSFMFVCTLPGKLSGKLTVNAQAPFFPPNPSPTTQTGLRICFISIKHPYSFPVKQQSNHSMLGVHASAWAIIHYGYIARKQGLTGVCLDSLSRLVVAHVVQVYVTNLLQPAAALFPCLSQDSHYSQRSYRGLFPED